MTGFRVQPPALRELADLLDRAKEDVQAGRSYLLKEVAKIDGVGVINRITGRHETVVETLDTWLREVADGSLAATTSAVRDAATYYDRTDQATAARVDATYPASYLTDAREHTDYVPIDPPEDTARFGDVTDPRKHLVEVHDYTREMDSSPDWWDGLSPMVHFGNVIESVTWVAVQLDMMEHPLDLQAQIVKPWVGDWAGVRAAADVFDAIGQLLRTTSSNVNWASQSTEDVWQGRAGEGCALYLMNLGRPLGDAWSPLGELSDQYKTASEEMVALRDALVGLLNMVGDAAVQAAVAAGVVGGAASSGVGAPLALPAALFAGWKVKRVVDGIDEMFSVIGKFDTAAKVAEAALTDFGNLAGRYAMPNLPPLPETPR